MAILPTGYVVGTRGVHASTPTEEIGGTIIGITTATTTGGKSPLTQPFQLNSGVPLNRLNFNIPQQASGTAHTFSATKAVSSGTFAYEQSEFLIRGVCDRINGVASTLLQIGGNEQYRLRRDRKLKSWGYKYSTAIRAGYFRLTKISGQRTPWSTAPSALNDTFRSTTNNGTDADDQALFVTYRSIPGEYVFMPGTKNPYQGDYPARTL